MTGKAGKYVFQIILCIFLFTVCAATARAATETVTDGTFTVTYTDTANGTLSGYSGTATDISIPETVTDGTTTVTVTGTHYGAFKANTSITKVTLPSTMTSIGNASFSGCTALKGVTIPDSVTSIGNQAFYQCTSLTNISIPDSVSSIGFRAFNGCTALKTIEIPSGVSSIGSQTFYNCSSLSDITFPSSSNITSISSGAFQDCTSLTGIELPDGLVTLYLNAFKGCTNLSYVKIPSSVTSIGSNAFTNCSSSLEIYGESGSYAESYAESNGYTYKIYATGAALDNTSVTLANTETKQLAITYTPSDAYDDGVTWSSSNESVATVSDSGLITAVSTGTATIKAVTINGNHTVTCNVTVENYVTEITLDKSEASVLDGETLQLTASVLPETADDKTYTWSSSNTSVAIVSDGGLVTATNPGTAIITATANDGGGASASCTVTVLTTIVSKGKEISYTSGKVKAIYTVTCDTKGKLTVEFKKLSKKNVKEVMIPSTIKDNNGNVYTVTGIAKKAFKGNTKVKKITIPNTVITIKQGAFSGCTNLKKVVLNGNTLKTIGKKAFKNINDEIVIVIKAKNKKTFNTVSKKIKKAGATNATFKHKKK